MRIPCLLLAALVVSSFAGCVKKAKKADCEQLAAHMQQLSTKEAVKKGHKADDPAVKAIAKTIHDSYLRRCCGNTDDCSDSWTMKRVTCLMKKDSTVAQAERKCRYKKKYKKKKKKWKKRKKRKKH